MGYFIRVFIDLPLSSLVPLQAQMFQAGFNVKPAGTNQLDILYARDSKPLTADLYTAEQPVMQEKIRAFIEAVSQMSEHPNQKPILDVLAKTQAMVSIGVPDGFSEADYSGVLDKIMGIVLNMAAGIFHVEGEGFYHNGELILPLK